MATEKIEFLNNQLRNAKPGVSLDRARLVTKYYQQPSIESPIARKAKMLKYLLENMEIYIADEEIVVGNHGEAFRTVPVHPEYGTEWILEDIDTFDTRTTDRLRWLHPGDKEELIEICKAWRGRGFREIIDSHLPAEAKEAALTGILTIGSRIVSTASHMPDFATILSKGFRAMIQEIQAKLDGIEHYDFLTQEQKDTWEGMIITLEAAIAFAHRYADLAEKMAAECGDARRKAELLAIAETCRLVPEFPAQTFAQATQFVWFIHLVYQIENAGHNHSIGRFDQFMYPYFQHDIEAGILDEAGIVELIQALRIKWTEIFELRDHIESEAYAGFPMWTNVTIGGVDGQNKDACNRLTYLYLEAADGAQVTQPAISFRYNKKCDGEIFKRALKLTQKGLGQPAFFNDEINIPRVLADGGTIKEARDYAILGCVEATVPGKTDFRPVAGFINVLKVLEFVLHNGYDPKTKKQVGPQTGRPEDFKTMDEVWQAYQKQFSFFCDMHLNAYGMCSSLHSQIAPTVFASTTVEGCIEKGRILQKNGAKYSSTGTFISGVANTIDSLAVIDRVVFQKQMMTLREMVDMLDSNYAGKEEWRELFKNKMPHYGNDDPFVDEYGRKLMEFCAEENGRHQDSRFGPYQLIILNQTYNIWQGRCVGATPDGRSDGEPMANNASPINGLDRNGPTAVGNSIGSLDTLLVQKGVLVNHKFDPAIAKGDKGLEMIGAFVKGYCDAGGQHVQINVIDEATLRDAQKHPENYKNLMVRVAGYSAFFVELDQQVQEDIIKRTEHRSCC